MRDEYARVPVPRQARRSFSHFPGTFCSAVFSGHPLCGCLDNLARRVIRPIVGDRWHGWHAFRRGLSTVLFGLGVPAEIAAVIFRHADAEVTRKHYILLKSNREGRAAMRQLGKIVEQAEPPEVAQTRVNSDQSRRSSVGRAADS